jgi:hypothetical protein
MHAAVDRQCEVHIRELVLSMCPVQCNRKHCNFYQFATWPVTCINTDTVHTRTLPQHVKYSQMLCMQLAVEQPASFSQGLGSSKAWHACAEPALFCNHYVQSTQNNNALHISQP